MKMRLGILSSQYVALRYSLQNQFKKLDKRLRPIVGGLINSLAVSLGLSQAASHGFSAFNELLAGTMSLPEMFKFTVIHIGPSVLMMLLKCFLGS